MDIKISEDLGYVTGHTINLPDNLEELVSYFQTHLVFDPRDVANELAAKYSSIAILYEMKVDKSQQGKGYGKTLLRRFIAKAPR
jgi:GNAT superfamily N-acetyltransferase